MASRYSKLLSSTESPIFGVVEQCQSDLLLVDSEDTLSAIVDEDWRIFPGHIISSASDRNVSPGNAVTMLLQKTSFFLVCSISRGFDRHSGRISQGDPLVDIC